MDVPNSFKSVKSALTIVDLKGYVKVYKSGTLHMQGVNVGRGGYPAQLVAGGAGILVIADSR